MTNQDQNRRTGQTTRHADNLIQELFTNKTIVFKDHSGVPASTQGLLRIIVKRMASEHPDTRIDYCFFSGWGAATIGFKYHEITEAKRFLRKEIEKIV